MNTDEQKLIDQEFKDLHSRMIQRLIDGGFDDPDSNTYPFFLWATGQLEGNWNTMISQVANNFKKEIKREQEAIKPNRAARRLNNKRNK